MSVHSVLAVLAVSLITIPSAAGEPTTNRGPAPGMRPASTTAAPRTAALKMTGLLRTEFINRAGPSYRLVSVTCELDGVQACKKTGNLGDRFPLFTRRVSAGNHRWSVVAVYQGSGGVFSYAGGFRYVVRNGGELTADVDRVTSAKIMAFESGGPTVPMADRLRMAISTK